MYEGYYWNLAELDVLSGDADDSTANIAVPGVTIPLRISAKGGYLSMVRLRLNVRRNRLLAGLSCLMLAGLSHASRAQSWNLATDYSGTNNPTGAWTYGYLTGSTFNVFTQTVYSASFGSTGWYSGTLPNVPYIGINDQGSTVYGISPGQVSLGSDYGVPEARWTAPSTGIFNVSAEVGGTLLEDIGFGNANADLAALQINGVNQGVTGVSNNVYSWSISNVSLTAGQTVDIYIGQQVGAGNTNTVFSINEITPSTPEPGTVGFAVGLAVSGAELLRRRRSSPRRRP